MYIFKATGLRGPAYPGQTPCTTADGTRHIYTPMELLQEVPDPVPPSDAQEHPDWYFCNDIDEAPYRVWTRKEQADIDSLG